LNGQKCPSKSVQGSIEDAVWQDIEGFLRNPGEVLENLAAKTEDQGREAGSLQTRVTALQQNLAGKDQERNLVLGLFRKGRIDEAALDQQLDQIKGEEAGLKKQLEQLAQQIKGIESAEAGLTAAKSVPQELKTKLDQPLTWDLKRQLVEALVEGIRVDTVDDAGKKDAVITVTYRFGAVSTSSDGSSIAPIVNCTGMDFARRRA